MSGEREGEGKKKLSEQVAEAASASVDDHVRVDVYLDDQAEPILSYRPPVNFELDTTMLEDGEHTLRVEAFDSGGVKGVKTIPFTVRNGPGIAIHGISPGDVVDGKLPVLVNAYGGASEKYWEPARAETPAPIPTWTWVLVIFTVAFGVFYGVRNWVPTSEFAGTPTFAPDLTAVVAAAPAATPAAPPPAAEGATEVTVSGGAATSTPDGAATYASACAACHQASGEGLPGAFPPLKDSAVVLDPDPTTHITTVLHGLQGSTIGGVTYNSPMPPFAAQLSDEQIAAVVNHERASWGNSAPGVSAADVAALR